MSETLKTESAGSDETTDQTTSTSSENADGGPESDKSSSEPLKPLSPLEAVTEILAEEAQETPAEEAPAPSAEEEEGSSASQQAPPPATLKEFAETNGFDVKELYGLNVPLPGSDGESVTVGELKDFVPKFKEAEQELAQEFQSLNQQKTELIAAQRELAMLHQESGVEVTPERLERLKQMRATHLDREYQRFLSAVPELQEPTAMKAWQQELAEYLPKWGVDPSEIVIEDSRVAALLHRLTSLEKQLDKLASFKPEKVAPKQAKSSGPGRQRSSLDRMMQQARHGTETQKVAAVSKLLGG